MRKDLHTHLAALPALTPQTINSNTSTHGAIIDTQGYGALEFVIQTATITDGAFTPLIEEGNAPDLADANAVADANLFGTEAAAAFTAGDDNKVKRIGYWIGSKRYVRLSLVSSGVTTGGMLGAIAILATADLEPITCC